jgi:hypothetical protein
MLCYGTKQIDLWQQKRAYSTEPISSTCLVPQQIIFCSSIFLFFKWKKELGNNTKSTATSAKIRIWVGDGKEWYISNNNRL